MATLSLHEAALSYAERGYPVFPVKASGKKPAGGHGFKDATVEVRRVDQWWEKNQRYNIGLSCEPMLILDIDRKSGGDVSFARMCEEIGAGVFDGVPFVNTPGGRHYWYRRPEPPIKRRTNLRPGVDLLGVGGYAIAPPSVRSDGSYVWGGEFADDAEELLPGDLPEFPRVVRDYLIGATPARVGPRLVAVRSDTNEFGKIALGDRTLRLVSLAGTLVAGNFPALADTLRAFNASACVPPLTEDELNPIIDSTRSFEPRFADGAFILPWLKSDLGTDSLKLRHNAMCMLVLMSKSAAANGTWAPPRSQVTELLGLSKDEFYEARNALEACGAIVVHPRGTYHNKLSSVVLLQWKPGLRVASDAA